MDNSDIDREREMLRRVQERILRRKTDTPRSELACRLDSALVVLPEPEESPARGFEAAYEKWATRDHHCEVCRSPHKLPMCLRRCCQCGATDGVDDHWKARGAGYDQRIPAGGYYCRVHLAERQEHARWPAIADRARRFGGLVGEHYATATAAETGFVDLAIGFFREPGLGWLIQGSVGTGKTYLAAAAARIWFLAGRGVEFTPSRRLFRMIRETYRDDSDLSETDIVTRFTGADLLVIDDLGREGRITEQVQSVLHEVLDERIRANRATVVTTNLGDDVGAVYGDAIASRLSLLVPIVIDGRDRRQP